MSQLLVETLTTELSQEINYDSDERCSIACFIPYIYFHNAVGSFTFEIESDYGVIFSKSFTAQDIKDSIPSTANYAHVFYPIIPTNPVQIERGSFTFRLIAGAGYSVTQSSFIGWIKQHEDIQNRMSYNPASDNENTFAIRFKMYKEGINA